MYCVMASMGFATLENILYGVFDFGLLSHSALGLLCTVATFIATIVLGWRAIQESSRLSGAFRVSSAP